VFFETRELRLSTTLIPRERGFGAISNNYPALVPTNVFWGTFFNEAQVMIIHRKMKKQ